MGMPRKSKSTIDHDGLHKQLFTHFFQQFLEGFFPEVAAELDFSDFGPENFLTQELFPELDGRPHHLDLVARVKAKGKASEAYLIVFIEAQGKRRPEFLARVFRYFALLHIKYGTVVIPIVVYGDASRRPLSKRWTRYAVEFAGHRFLDFRFLAVHPSSMPVREYLNSHNPAQLALAARMDIGEEDMVRIKLDLLRQMARLTMTQAQIEQALRYVDAYLEETEPGALQRELAAMKQAEYQEAGMLIEHFTNLGIEKGIRAKALEDAQKMREHGIEWSIVTNVTGIRPEDLETK
jgi:hypothetical protein